jgi:hypothetical protein
VKLIFAFILISTFAEASGADFYRITPGASEFISAHGLCGTVTNNFSTDLFVSTKTEKEWKTALTPVSSSVAITRSGCSCKSLLAMGNFLSGVYSIDLDSAGPLASFNVYCDMVTDGGGWTLVGRSVAGAPASTSFGWTSSLGSVTDDSQPYSLGVDALRLPFTEVLMGEYSSAKTWGTYVYKRPAPTNFISAYSTTSTDYIGPTPISGGNFNFVMGARIGFTNLGEKFYFRDHSEDAGYGFYPYGWKTAYADHLGGYILDHQGMVMIR